MAFRGAPDILFSRMRFDDSHTVDRYVRTGGYEALPAALKRAPEELVDEVKASGLRGRGGAGFSAGMKWSFLPADTFPRYLVVNADEGEPATFKDHQLIERDPHQLIEGTAIAAYALKCTLAFIYIRGEFALGLERLTQAVADAYARGHLGRDIFRSGFDLDIVVHAGAGAYICGEETALLSSLEGQRGEPRIRPPFPAVKGLYQKPTVVNNVETLSNLPWIVQHGGAAYAALGKDKSTGTRIWSLSGHVNRPGNYETELATVTFRDLFFDPELGGGIRGGEEVKAFVPGGASAPWFGPDQLDCPLDLDEVQRRGSMLGSGSVVVMNEHTCAVRAAWRITKFFAHESCGKCTPCREGGSWLERVLRRIELGAGREEDLDLLLDVCDNLAPGLSWPPGQTTICVLGPSIPSSIYTSIRMFRDEYLTHVKEGGCPFR
ncbi:MAG: NADH-quinone oxidoreductase subunit NuoF [Actinobacteria bacterium]|nr:MAG: NADH-quinone oxidoreductase subunit NuoF [Actinomycetota bacterium]